MAKQLIGDINDAFVVPRYVRLFYDTFGAVRNQSFFDVGSGTATCARPYWRATRDRLAGVTSECFPEGVEWLRQRGLESILGDAMSLPA